MGDNAKTEIHPNRAVQKKARAASKTRSTKPAARKTAPKRKAKKK